MFRGVPHTDLEAIGGGAPLVQPRPKLEHRINKHNFNRIRHHHAAPNQLRVQKQRCPLSGLLFNIGIDHVLRALQSDAAKRRVLAFADDTCIIADSPAELQSQLNLVADLTKTGLHLNPSKCVSGRTPVGTRNTIFHVQDHPLRALLDSEATQPSSWCTGRLPSCS